MTDIELQNIRSSRTELEAALREAGVDNFKGLTCRCPFHDDKHPSAGIHLDADGAWRFYCHTNSCKFSGDAIDVRARARNKKPEDLLRESNSKPFTSPAPKTEKPRNFADVAEIEQWVNSWSQVEAVYKYSDPQTKKIELIVVRHKDGDGKKFLQIRGDGERFALGQAPKPWPIYNRSRLASAEPIFIVEGEKCVHALHDIRFVATTSPGGAGNGDKADWTPLAGRKVYFWPDNDKSGMEYMETVCGILEKLTPPAMVMRIDPTTLDLPEKSDCVDFIKHWTEGGDQEECRRAIEAVMTTAHGGGADEEARVMIQDMISGRRTAEEFPWAQMSQITKALLPGTVTMICGEPESGKSLFISDALLFWHQNNIPIAHYAMEDSRGYHILRALAQLENNSNLTNDSWVKANPDESMAAWERNQKTLFSFGQCIYTAPKNIVKIETLAEWVEKMASEGKRIICIDPITAAEVGRSPWIDDKEFMIKAKAAVSHYGASLVILTHPRIGDKQGGFMAGGSAYLRFSQTVIWLRKLTPPKSVRMKTGFGSFTGGINRMVKIGKARNAIGGGQELGFNLEPGSLRFSEQGLIVDDDAPEESESVPL